MGGGCSKITPEMDEALKRRMQEYRDAGFEVDFPFSSYLSSTSVDTSSFNGGGGDTGGGGASGSW